MRNLVKWFLGYEREFYDFEKKLLETVRTHLSIDAQVIFQAQIDSINRIQRLTNGKEVNLYAMKFGRVRFDDRLRFANIQSEALLATAVLTNLKTEKNMKVEMRLVTGHLFSLRFAKPPHELFDTHDLEKVQAKISDVKIWLDPMIPEPPCLQILHFDHNFLGNYKGCS